MYTGQTAAIAEDDSFERLPDANDDNLQVHVQEDSRDIEKSYNSTPQQYVNISPPIQEDEDDAEDNEEFLDCMEWNLDTCAVTDSIELKCLSEIEIILKRQLTGVEEDKLAIHDKLKVLRQTMMCMSETIEELRATLENERVKLKEVEEERDMLVDYSKDYESKEKELSKMVEDLKSQVVLFSDLVYGRKKQATKTKGE